MRFGVYIGRFQPFHLGHLAIVQEALEHVDHLIILIGCGAEDGHSERNPWTAQQRSVMIARCFTPRDFKSITLRTVADMPDEDFAWCSAVQRAVRSVAYDSPVTLFGCDKDESTRYLTWFPEYASKLSAAPYNAELDGTRIRAAWRSGDIETVKAGVHPAVFAYLRDLQSKGGER